MVEVKKPGQKKAMPTSSGKKNRKAFSGKFGHVQNSGGQDDDIEEDIQTDRD